MSVASMSTEYRIMCVEMSTDGRGDGFLSDISMAGTMNQSSLMTSRQFFFGLANNLHRAIKRNELFVGHDSSVQTVAGNLRRFIRAWRLRIQVVGEA